MPKPLEKITELKPQADDTGIGLSVDSLKRAMVDNLFYIQGRFPVIATQNDNYMALDSESRGKGYGLRYPNTGI